MIFKGMISSSLTSVSVIDLILTNDKMTFQMSVLYSEVLDRLDKAKKNLIMEE